MSVRLVLCVADSVWRAAGHLARVCTCPWGALASPVRLVLCVADSVWRAASMSTAHSHRVLCVAVSVAHSHRACSDAAVAAGCAPIPLPPQTVPAVPRP